MLDQLDQREQGEAEVVRLRKRVGQQDRALATLAEALSVLRRASIALREENRELRLALQTSSPSRASRAGRTLV